jgi:hypothetical protein
MTEPWEKPDLGDTWEIHDIADALAFLRFVFEVAPHGSRWIVSGAAREAERRLTAFALPREEVPWFYFGFFQRPLVIPLPDDPAERRRLLNGVPAWALVEQHVYADNRAVLVSYDNLSCCWLTRDVPVDTLREAAARTGFRFVE